MILDLLPILSKSVEWQVLSLIFVLNNKKLSSHVDQITEPNNSPNHKLISMIKCAK